MADRDDEGRPGGNGCARAPRERALALLDRRSRKQRIAVGGVVTMRAMSEPLHLVDTTMFWSPTGGGVRRYLQTKHAWLAGQPRWRHSIAVPRVAGSAPARRRCRRWPLPGSGGYRLPLRRARDRARPRRPRARPDRGRRPVPRRLGRARRGAAARRPGGRLLPLEHRRDGAARRRAALRRDARRACGRALCAPRLPRLRPRPRAEPQHGGAPRRLGRRSASPASRSASTRRSSIPRRATPRWRERRGWPDDARAARLRRPLRAREAPRRPRRRGRAASARRYLLLAVGAGPAPPPRGERVVVLPFVASATRARDHAGERRRVRPRRRPGDLRPVGARGDGVRHAGRRSRRRRPGRARRRRAPRVARARRHRRRRSPKRSRRSSPATAASDRAPRARRAEASDWQRRPARPRSATTCACSARAPTPTPARARDAAPPRRCNDEQRRHASGRVCIVLHDAAPSTRLGVRCERWPRSARSRRRAGDDPRRAALPRRGADARPSSAWLGDALAPRRRARAARLHASRRRHGRTAGSTACGAALHRAAKASSGRSRASEALARHRRRHRLVRDATAGRSPASSRRPGCSARARAQALVERPLRLHRDAAPAGPPARRSARCTSQSVVYSTSSAWRRAASLAWNAVVASAGAAQPGCCASSCTRATPTSPRCGARGRRILERALATGEPATVAEFMRRTRRGARRSAVGCATTRAVA